MTVSLTPGIHPFGSRPDGQAVERIVLCDDTLGVAVLTQGAILQDVRLARGGLRADHRHRHVAALSRADAQCRVADRAGRQPYIKRPGRDRRHHL